MAQSDSERAANSRYRGQLERLTDKLLGLIENPPSKYKDSFALLPNRFELAEDFYDCCAMLLKTHWHVEENDDGQLSIRIPLPEPDSGMPEGFSYSDFDSDKEVFDYYKDVIRSEASFSKTSFLNRNAFCQQVLGAQLTNARWGWVAVAESDDDQPGALYFFAWEHNRDMNQPGTVRLFHREVSADEKGRRRPGHRDALEKVERVSAGEYTPYIVWQTAVDPEQSPKKIQSINSGHITECELYLDENGYWNGRLVADHPTTEAFDFV